MNGNSRPPATPLSPVSVGGSEWSYPGDNNYPNRDGPGSDGPPFPPQGGPPGPYPPPNNRGPGGPFNSPPDSRPPPMNGNYPPGPPGPPGGPPGPGGGPPGPRSTTGGPSPPPSIGRSSTGTNLYARSESGRSQSQALESQEGVLMEHYNALKAFLSATSQNGKPNPPPNRARDKLQRLTAVQFLELSTDVYDELKRREAFARRPPNAPPGTGPPEYLLPEESFHPKRNQARQKLSSLGPPRFRDLATDVFCELERRFPHFAGNDIPRVGTPMSVRGGPGSPSRSQTPINGYPPRDQSRRRPSEASSIRSGRSMAPPMMNGAPGPGPGGSFPVPPSPSVANGDYPGRPMPKQFQSNTIVPNKSTMVEEDDDNLSPLSSEPRDGFSRRRDTGPSESEKKIIEEYEQQVRDLREKLDNMEEQLRKKDEELNGVLNGERRADEDRKAWDEARAELEKKLAEAQEMSDNLQRELDRVRDEHENETRQLREQLEEARRASSRLGSAAGDAELERENKALRMALEEQEQVTEEVRREAQAFLREMRMISEQSGAAWEKQSMLEKTIENLENEVRLWQNRYARTRAQLRDMRGASADGVSLLDQDAARYVREKGFVDEEAGMVKDVHVTKFQMAIDELLQRARTDAPDRVIDSMKAVVVSVRRITKNLDAGQLPAENGMQFQKLKSRVSSTANNLITASKNFANSAGISPVSLLDAAASHLVAAVVELLKLVKIRPTPADELENDDYDDDNNGTVTPIGTTTGFFSPRSQTSMSHSHPQSQVTSKRSTMQDQPSVPPVPPPPFRGGGLGGNRDSVSSAYSPVPSPRESSGTQATTSAFPKVPAGRVMPNGTPAGNGTRVAQDLKIYLDDQTASLVQTIQNLVQLVRSDADIDPVQSEISSIASIVNAILSETDQTLPPHLKDADLANGMDRLASCRERLLEAGARGVELANSGEQKGGREWKMWNQTLPPIAFEIARGAKELVGRVERIAGGPNEGDADDFS